MGARTGAGKKTTKNGSQEPGLLRAGKTNL